MISEKELPQYVDQPNQPRDVELEDFGVNRSRVSRPFGLGLGFRV